MLNKASFFFLLLVSVVDICSGTPKNKLCKGNNPCPSIAEFICERKKFTTLCTAVTAAGLTDFFNTTKLTVFAPNDFAFSNLADGVLDSLLDDIDALENVLKYHALEGKFQFKALKKKKCNSELTMYNGVNSTLVCKKQRRNVKIIGGGNTEDNEPKIVENNIKLSNGRLNVINNVMIPP